jgi:hypothetical protein
VALACRSGQEAGLGRLEAVARSSVSTAKPEPSAPIAKLASTVVPSSKALAILVAMHLPPAKAEERVPKIEAGRHETAFPLHDRRTEIAFVYLSPGCALRTRRPHCIRHQRYSYMY